MDPVRNPYTPNAGAEPEVITGRDDLFDSFDILLRRLRSGRTDQSMVITGLRGVGKTVVLGKFRSLALGAGWVVVELEVSKHDDAGFRRELAAGLRSALFELSPRARWGERLRFASAVLQSFTLGLQPDGSISVSTQSEHAEGYADHGDLSLDLTDLLIAVGEAAASVDSGVVLLLDEVQFLSSAQLEAVIGALHRLVQRKLPVTMVGAGLPQIAELAGDAKSYAERLLRFPVIGVLDGDDADEALAAPARAEGVDFSAKALARAREITGGYPYFIQELGYAIWRSTDASPVTRDDVEQALDIYESKLDSSFFRVRLDRTTGAQKAYLRAMASLGSEPQKAADVARVLGRTSPQVAPTRAELIGMGLLYTPEHGYAAFTVPHFDQFMIRTMPDLPVPTSRSTRKPPRGAQ
ncbi:MAG: ATP-binding protein [Candidatus Nanopelagicales bacterium]|nr:ATP-binding protein [Candidatus Nanopelagicales bacterium]MCF8536809.1 ATP-binding protein [Candidatus Nanopelagicales bacterium]MCF8541794.1 ATP-binding protein [Candidatus Nanopelagicales bacterium]MCF8556165.1 ATP-binding protein [Candidatus Nanopelagicales bacterium]